MGKKLYRKLNNFHAIELIGWNESCWLTLWNQEITRVNRHSMSHDAVKLSEKNTHMDYTSIYAKRITGWDWYNHHPQHVCHWALESISRMHYHAITSNGSHHLFKTVWTSHTNGIHWFMIHKQRPKDPRFIWSPALLPIKSQVLIGHFVIFDQFSFSNRNQLCLLLNRRKTQLASWLGTFNLISKLSFSIFVFLSFLLQCFACTFAKRNEWNVHRLQAIKGSFFLHYKVCSVHLKRIMFFIRIESNQTKQNQDWISFFFFFMRSIL